MPRCGQCGKGLPRDSFSKNQLSKGPEARCHACVHGGNSDLQPQHPNVVSRTNNSSRATFDSYELDHPFAHGAFRWVARGSYTHGDRAGEPCVCKWFKSGAVFEATFFELDIKAVHKAVEIVKKWNAAGVINKTVRLNIPKVWQWDNGARKRAGSKTLVEPFIEKWQKFNSNSGWNDGEATPWSRVMQALSHFSYHATAGSCVLCDLQGGVYADGVVLTDPVILSRDRQFGVTDLGTQGISTFFSQHQCNEFCRRQWSRPRDETSYYRPQKGTSMEIAPTRASRPGMSVAGRRVPLPAFQELSDDEDYY